MRLIIEARVERSDSDLQPEPIRVAVLDRIDGDVEQLGLELGSATRAQLAKYARVMKEANIRNY